jgi:integrase
MLDLAVRHDAIPTNPARGTTRVHRPKQETKALRVEDLVEIRAAVRRWVNADRPGPKATGDMADIIDLMLATGCRIGEILALRWSDLDLDSDLPILTVSGTIKTETGKGTYRKPTPKSDASRRSVVLPQFAAELLRMRREFATPNENDAVFATRNGTWNQVVNVERRWRQIRKDTGYEWVTPHTFRKTVATLISEATTSELASRQLGHSSSQVTRAHYIAKPPVSADLSELLERLAEKEDTSADS